LVACKVTQFCWNKKREAEKGMTECQRLLFFDTLRILSISLIVFSHVALLNLLHPFDNFPRIFNIFELNIGKIGVYLLIFISGSVLEYNYKNITSIQDLIYFYAKRLSRIYPALWIMALIVLCFNTQLITLNNIVDLFWGFTGFTAFVGQWNGILPGSSNWFIGVIVVLYLLFPLLSHTIKKWPFPSMIILAIFSFSSSLYFNTHNRDMFGIGTIGWFPPVYFFEMGIGIYIVQKKLYPKRVNSSKVIIFLAELTFPLFLMHGFLLYLSKINIVLFIFATLFLSTVVYLMDNEVQKMLKKYIHKLKPDEIADGSGYSCISRGL
jgi:peptidoglycan/LPS O-acetylase OafA/YrhL